MNHNEEHARELLARHANPVQTPERRKAHVHMWAAVSLCSAVVVVAYAFIASSTYDFFEVKQSLGAALQQVTSFGASATPVIDKPKMMWTQLQIDLSKQAQAKVETKVIEEMKKEITPPKK